MKNMELQLIYFWDTNKTDISISFYLKCKETERDCSFVSSLLKCWKKPGLGQTESRSPEFILGLPCRRQEPKYLSYLSPAGSQGAH